MDFYSEFLRIEYELSHQPDAVECVMLQCEDDDDTTLVNNELKECDPNFSWDEDDEF